MSPMRVAKMRRRRNSKTKVKGRCAHVVLSAVALQLVYSNHTGDARIEIDDDSFEKYYMYMCDELFRAQQCDR